ncbi:MAG: ABC transporter permease [Planctomycetes bacterium]|jgi:putative ABC transport system permease protein|nr:ABC transporter permease [Planctomycetota bacterium]
MSTESISAWGIVAMYCLLAIPFGVLLWARLSILGQAALSIIRMSVQLLFVGIYLEVVFRLNNPWLNLLWLLVMVAVADGSILKGCGLRLWPLAGPLFVALIVGVAVPLLYFIAFILGHSELLDAQYAIPIGGMILGNCLRADIIGIRSFFLNIRKSEKAYFQRLADGATLAEATRPYLTHALHEAIAPTLATIATTGLVSLPGMMTGVILGGAKPMTAILYQIAIMIAIFTGTSITVLLGIQLCRRIGFTPWGTLNAAIFR